MQRGIFQVFGSFSTRTNSWDVSASFLNTLCDLFGIEHYGDIEEGESEYQKEVYSDVKPARIIHGEVFQKKLSDLDGSSRSPIRQDLSDQCREGDDGYRKDNRYHPRLIDPDREVGFLVSPGSGVDEGDFSVSFGEFDDDVDDCEGHKCEREKEGIIAHGNILHDVGRNPGKNPGEYDHRASIPDSRFIDNLSEPHKKEGSGSDKQHRRKNHSVEIAHIHNLSPASDEGIEENNHPVTLCERERNGHPTGVVIDFLLPLFPFFFQSLQLWDDDRQELHNNDRVDVRSKPHEDDREVFQTTTHQGAEESETLIRRKKVLNGKKGGGIYPGNRDNREELVQYDNTERNEDFFLHIGWLPDTGNILEDHRRKQKGYKGVLNRRIVWKSPV